jgi:hypothetical protein
VAAALGRFFPPSLSPLCARRCAGGCRTTRTANPRSCCFVKLATARVVHQHQASERATTQVRRRRRRVSAPAVAFTSATSLRSAPASLQYSAAAVQPPVVLLKRTHTRAPRHADIRRALASSNCARRRAPVACAAASRPEHPLLVLLRATHEQLALRCTAARGHKGLGHERMLCVWWGTRCAGCGLRHTRSRRRSRTRTR